ncbi:MAG: Xaa-Pro peptidase family protein [Hyphomicrobiaceae bacterium]
MKGNFQKALEDTGRHKEAPFPVEEYRGRLTRIRAEMAERKLDLLFVTAPESLFYVSGFACEWYQAQSGRAFPPTSGIAIHREHDKTIHFETPSEAILTGIGTVSEDVRIFPIESRRNGLPFIVKELRAAGWLKRGTSVGLERYSYRPNPVMSGMFVTAFEEAGAKVADATEVLHRVRHVKSALEMASLEKAAKIADIGMKAAHEAIAPGVTELEVFGHMIAAMTKAGGEFPGILPPVMSGFRTNALHPLATRKKIRKGERVNVDLCGVYNRYHVNLARGFWVGEPPKAALDLHNRSIGVFKVIKKLLKPDLDVLTFCRALKDYYVDQGIWDEAYWSGGYEFGIAFPPDWVGPFIYDLTISKEGERFRPMTAVNHECNFFGPDKTGMSATIDTFLFYEDKAKIASKLPREIQVIGG